MPDGLYGNKYLLHASCLTGKWPEGKASKKKDALAWKTFLLSIIFRFGCIPVFICDGGSEFKGAARMILEEYGIAVIISSPYNPPGNGIAERDGQTLKNAILKACGDQPRRWPLYVDPGLLAVRVTTSRATGFTPYFLTYGQHALFPFDISDRTWFLLDWDDVYSTEDLLSLRMKQLARREEDIGTAVQHLEESRRRAAEDANRANAHRMRDEELLPGMWVLVHETWLDAQHGHKAAVRWAGPFVIHQRHPSGSYALRELDGTVLKEAVAASRLKVFYFRDTHQTRPTACHAPFNQVDVTSIMWNAIGRPYYCGAYVSAPTLGDALIDHGDGTATITWRGEGWRPDGRDNKTTAEVNIPEIIAVAATVAPWSD